MTDRDEHTVDSYRAPVPLAAALPLVLALSACADGRDPDGGRAAAEAGAGAGTAAHGFDVPLPEPLLQTRAVNRERLVVDVSIGGFDVEAVREGETWIASTTVAPGREVPVEIVWHELLGEEDLRLPLATFSELIGPFGSDATFTIDPDRYVTESDELDEDGDGFFNLRERELLTDPYDGDTPLVIPHVEDASLVTLDGSYENEIWDRSAGRGINRLVIDGRGLGREPVYNWRSMHDGTHLYLIVRFEGELGGDGHTPVDDSPEFFADDALNLFVDAGRERGERLALRSGGGDDTYLVFPLPPNDEQDDPPPRTPFDPRVEEGTANPYLPDGLEYAACACLDTVAGWEIKVPLESLGLETGRPFGIELHLDQDLADDDDPGRDERWGWSYPSQADREEAGVEVDEGYFERPALFGTAVLAD